MTAPGTPGPWVADRTCVKNAGEVHHFTCGLTRTAYATNEQMHANANLIAAAPCMYEALVRVRESLGSPVSISRRAVARDIDATLAKARGEVA